MKEQPERQHFDLFALELLVVRLVTGFAVALLAGLIQVSSHTAICCKLIPGLIVFGLGVGSVVPQSVQR